MHRGKRTWEVLRTSGLRPSSKPFRLFALPPAHRCACAFGGPLCSAGQPDGAACTPMAPGLPVWPGLRLGGPPAARWAAVGTRTCHAVSGQHSQKRAGDGRSDVHVCCGHAPATESHGLFPVMGTSSVAPSGLPCRVHRYQSTQAQYRKGEDSKNARDLCIHRTLSLNTGRCLLLSGRADPCA